MGLFDYIRCEMPLQVEGANAFEYQTKDTPEQYMDNYVIRNDGTLWREDYDTEDHSDPNAEGFARIFGCETRVRKRWVHVTPFVGEVRFYAHEPSDAWVWLEFSAYFVGGNVISLNLIEARPAGVSGKEAA